MRTIAFGVETGVPLFCKTTFVCRMPHGAGAAEGPRAFDTIVEMNIRKPDESSIQSFTGHSRTLNPKPEP